MLDNLSDLQVDLESLKLILDYVVNGVTITNANSEILYVNSAFTAITGYEYREALGENPGILHSGRHQKYFYEQMWQHILQEGCWSGEIWNRRKSGETYPEL